MTNGYYNPFWLTVSAIITVGLLIYLFPLLHDKYGMAGAVLLSLLVPFAVGLAYWRGYWVCRWFAERRERRETSEGHRR